MVLAGSIPARSTGFCKRAGSLAKLRQVTFYKTRRYREHDGQRHCRFINRISQANGMD